MRARRALAGGWLCTALMSGCGDRQAAPEASLTAADDRAASLPPHAGPLTVARLHQAADEARPHRRWDAALGAVRAAAGQPARIDGDVHGWYLLDGGRCHFLEVTRDGSVGEVAIAQHGAAEERDGSYFARCAGAVAADAPAAAASAAPPGDPE